MKITKIEFIEHIVPNRSCGTGYSEPDRFHIYGDNGLETNILVDIWYKQEKYVKREFINGLRWAGWDNCENIDEAFEMYVNSLKPTNSCPYYWLKKRNEK